jgi:hypothetical protein
MSLNYLFSFADRRKLLRVPLLFVKEPFSLAKAKKKNLLLD